MSDIWMRCMILLLATTCSSPGSPQSQAVAVGLRATSRSHIDFKVVVWYRRDRPLESFRYEVYDARKGQYTAAVDAWVELMRRKYTAYFVAVREVDLEAEKGETEMLKVGAVVKRELSTAAAIEGIIVAYGQPAFGLPSISSQPLIAAPMSSRRVPFQSSHLGRSSDLKPPDATFPFPLPYPRPHP